MACDLAVMVDDAFIRHVGLGARLGSRRRRDAVAADLRPATGARARSSCSARRSPRSRRSSGGSSTASVRAAELDAVVDDLVEKLAAKLPQTIRYTKQQLNWWRDISWNETIGHARDWLSLSMLNDEAKEAIRAFLRAASERRARSRRARRAGRRRAAEPAEGAERVLRRADGRRSSARSRSWTPTRRSARSSSAAASARSPPAPTSRELADVDAESRSTRAGGSSGGTRSARCGRRSSPRCRASASAAAASSRCSAT